MSLAQIQCMDARISIFQIETVTSVNDSLTLGFRFRVKDSPLRTDGQMVVWQAHLCHNMQSDKFRYAYHENYQFGIFKTLLGDETKPDVPLASACFALAMGGVREYIWFVTSRATNGPFRLPAVVPQLQTDEDPETQMKGWTHYLIPDIALKKHSTETSERP